MTDGEIEIMVSQSPWIEKGNAIVIKVTDSRFHLVSDIRLSNDQMLALMAGYFARRQDAEELRNLREDCEAGMDLSNARKVLKDLDEIAWWARLRSQLSLPPEEK